MSTVSESDWAKGISLSIIASILGAGSKLAIRKSWLLQKEITSRHLEDEVDEEAEEDEESEREERFTLFSQVLACPASRADPADPSSDSTEKLCLRPAYALRFGGMMGMSIFNPLCCVLAMNYASPSILAPFSGLTLVWIIVLSDLLIQERASPRQVVAAALIVLGEIIISVFGDHTNDQNVTARDVRDSYIYPPFLLFLVMLCVWLALMTHWMKRGSIPLKRFAWGVAGGSITGLQCFLKDALIVLKDSHHNGSRHHLPWWFFLLVALAIASAFGGLLFLTACMKRYDVTFSSAMFVGSFIVSTSTMSVVHYGTFGNLHSAWNCALYPVGLSVLMSGVWMLVIEASKGDPIPLDSMNDDIVVTLQAPLMLSVEADDEAN